MNEKAKLFSPGLAFLFLGLLLTSSPAHAGLKESWYLYRGRENMKIKNYKAAVEAFENALRINSTNNEASKSLGLAYENQGSVDKAVSQYDSHLAKFPDDGEIALRQARLLKWDRYAYRQNDAVKYYRMALKTQPTSIVRLEYAEVLAAKKETSPESISEFNKVLAKDPKNGRAHKGLAKAYAWQGNQDQALYHAQLAQQYGDHGGDVQQLQRSIAEDRRPEAGGEFYFLNQTSQGLFDLSGIRFGGSGKRDASPFLTLNASLGAESFWNRNEHASGAYVVGAGQYRLTPQRFWDVQLTHHTMAVNGQEGKLEYTMEGAQSTWRPGIAREMIYDSYLSLVGSDKTGTHLGAARKNSFYVNCETTWDSWKIVFKPYLGWVTADKVSPNSVMGTDLSLTIPLSDSGESRWSIAGQTQFMHYETDHSGFGDTAVEPLAGGYFSPSSFFSQFVLAQWEYKKGDTAQWDIVLGPALQNVQDKTHQGTQVGAQFRGSYLSQMSKNQFIKAEVVLLRLSSIYTRAEIMAWATWKF